MKLIYQKRGLAFLAIFFIYVIAFGIGFLIYKELFQSQVEITLFQILLYTFIADVVATVIVFGFSVIFKNSSIYDPYWSVAPIAILLLWFFEFKNGFDLPTILIFVAVFVWGIRLTYNWAINFKGMQHQDWRYGHYKNANPRIWPLTNFFGIHLMPTIVVFLAMIPAAISLEYTQNPFSLLVMGLGTVLSVLAAVIQFIADKQMREFRIDPENKGKNIESGLWKYSRHPNYFGEITMWWGLFVLQLGVLPYYVTIIGPIAMTLLFVFISIPLMENHVLTKRPNYANYQRRVSPLVFWIPKQDKEEEEYERA